MHPAPSIILFTSVSGLGFGLLAFLCLGMPATGGKAAFFWFLAAYVLAAGGLAASAFHLGRPSRALKAFTQWRSSWLSREAVVSIAALAVAGVHALFLMFGGGGHALIGVSAAVLCLATVFCTAMIYTQLRTVPRWNHPVTPAAFLLYALSGGAMLAGEREIAVPLLGLLAGVQFAAWRIGDRRFARAGSTPESATGLGNPGRVRLLESPHTGPNYLTKEMVFVVGRKHVRALRVISLACACILPLAIFVVPAQGPLPAAAAVPIHFAGLLAARWLFFAEAEHVVGLYYGNR